MNVMTINVTSAMNTAKNTIIKLKREEVKFCLVLHFKGLIAFSLSEYYTFLPIEATENRNKVGVQNKLS